VHPGHHRLRDLLHERHQLGAGLQQRAHLAQVGGGHVGEVVAGAERRAVPGQHHTETVAGADLGEGGQQLVHVGQGQGVAAPGPVHGHGGEVARPLDQDVLVFHKGLLLRRLGGVASGA
jgi:hypothetical protein